MSRAYKIKVSESVSKVIRAEDHVSTQLEMLEILPCDQMADLLAEELVKQGFERKGGKVVRNEGDVTVEVDLESGTVSVRSEASDNVEVQGEKSGYGYDDEGPARSRKQAAENLRGELKQELEGKVERKEEKLQQQITDQLEKQLIDLRAQLDKAVNRATAEALKQKAAKIGQIKEMTEDPESGSLTIVVEV
ncbi:MAG: hypothetical protein AB8B55_13030 [Mariniblastus sp.]